MLWLQMACSLCRHFLETLSLAGMTSRAYGVRFITGRKAKGERVLDRGNPLVEPIPVPQGWTSTVPLHHTESSDRDDVRSQEKKCRESRDAVRPERWSLRTGPPPGSSSEAARRLSRAGVLQRPQPYHEAKPHPFSSSYYHHLL